MSAPEALQRLLSGTGIRVRLTGPTTATLVGRDSGADEAVGDGSILLEPIDVIGNEEGTVGFVATRSQTGTKTNTPIIETPQSISVVTRKQLDIREVTTDAEALTYTPGVFAQPFGGIQHQQNPFFFIRGFATAFGGSFVDSLVSPVNYRFEPYAYERYDILRGPTSVLYGLSDPGGLINRVSKLPQDEAHYEAKFQVGSYERIQGAFDIGGPVDPDGNVLYRLIGLARDGNAPIDYDYDIEAPDERQFIAPAFTFNIGESTTLTILGNYLDDLVGQESVYRNPDGTLTHIALIQPGLGNWSQEQYSAGYMLEHEFNDQLDFRQNFRYSHMDSDILSVYQGSLLPDGITVERFTDGNDEWRDDVAIDTQLQYDFTTGPLSHATLFGFDYVHSVDWISFKGGGAPNLNLKNPNYHQYFPPAVPYYQYKYTGDTYGLYVQDQITYDENWIVTLGGRQDWVYSEDQDELYGLPVEKRSNDDFTFRGGITYLSDFGLAPYFSYAQSFLPTAGTDINGVPFVPTTGEQYEIGIKYQPPGWNVFVAAAVYDLTKQNVLTPDPRYPTCTFCNVQTGEIRARGFEFEVTASLVNGLDLTAAYSYNDAKITKANPDTFGVNTVGNHAPRAPEHLASIWLDYTFGEGPFAGFNIGAGARYVGSNYADDENTIKNAPYFLVDAEMRYDLGNAVNWLDGAELAVNVTNLFDEQYQVCYTSFLDCNWGAGRIVLGTFTYRW